MPADTPPSTASVASNGSNGNHASTTPTTPTSPTITSTTPSNNTVSAAPPNNTRKRTPDEYTKNFDLNEISPLRTSSSSSSGASNGSRLANDKSELNAQRNNGITSTTTANSVLLPPVVLNMSRAPAPGATDATDAANDSDTCATDGTHLAGGRRNKFRGTYDDIVGRLDLSERARLPFVIVCALCVLLLAALIVVAIVWPRVPAYMRAPVCVEKECLAASAQVSGELSGGCAQLSAVRK